jgi:glucosyl-3-phosphoglycerate synthase
MCAVGRASSSGESFTFAVVGRNEAKTLTGMVAQAQEAARPGDRVCFVDSASEDESVAIASELGIEVIQAPRGKGRAMAQAFERCETRYLCFLDADLFYWTTNIPAALRAAATSTGAHMTIANFSEGRRRVITPALYWPLVDALFADYGRQCDPIPLSGLRVIDAALPIGPLPGGYGAETHLNLSFGHAGRHIAITDIGDVRGPLRGYSNVVEVAIAVVEAILDFAVVTGRIDPELRSHWYLWADEVIESLARVPPPGAPDEHFLATLRAVASRPFPPASSGRPVAEHT